VIIDRPGLDYLIVMEDVTRARRLRTSRHPVGRRLERDGTPYHPNATGTAAISALIADAVDGADGPSSASGPPSSHS